MFPACRPGAEGGNPDDGLFGDGIAALPYFGFGTFDVLGTRQVIARSGYSKQGGFEIYLEGGHLGGALWDLVWEAGARWISAPDART